jgi:uncharacterized protein (UPF0332 family)
MKNQEPQKALEKAIQCLYDTEIILKNELSLASVNRAYYTFYYGICALLLSKGVQTKTHQGMHNKFAELFIKTSIFDKEVNDWITTSFRFRQLADYDFEANITHLEAQEIVSKAHIFIDLVKDYFKKNSPFSKNT